MLAGDTLAIVPEDVCQDVYAPLAEFYSSSILHYQSLVLLPISDVPKSPTEDLAAANNKRTDTQNILVNTIKVGLKTKGVGDGCIAISDDKAKWLVKYMNISAINNIANCINEFVSYPLFDLFLKDTNIRLPWMALQKNTESGSPGVAIEFLDNYKDLAYKRHLRKPERLEMLLVVRYCIGDDDWNSSNILMGISSRQLATCDHGKAFMSIPSSAYNFLNYFESLFSRWYKGFSLDYSLVLVTLKRIYELYTQNKDLIEQNINGRIEVLERELGNRIIQNAVFVTRHDNCVNVKEYRFDSFWDYFEFCKNSLKSKLELIPEVLKIISEKVKQQEALTGCSDLGLSRKDAILQQRKLIFGDPDEYENQGKERKGSKRFFTEDSFQRRSEIAEGRSVFSSIDKGGLVKKRLFTELVYTQESTSLRIDM